MEELPVILGRLRDARAWTDDTRSLLVHDLDRMLGRIGQLQRRFPEGTLHGVAIKANPLVEVLRVAVEAGAGLEAASWEEVQLALAAGCPPSRVIFDSPAKTDAELAGALELGCWLNADHPGELERLEALGAPRSARVGLRVNPAVGAGSIGFTSTVARDSKFGVPLADAAGMVRRFPFITGLHVHTGSQGVGVALIEAAVRATAEAVVQLGMAWIDVGGGLPVRYTPRDDPPGPDSWAAALARTQAWGMPMLTEPGRWVQAPCGFAISRVEGIKDVDGVPTLVVHLGADFLLRRVYRPDDWDHELAVLDPQGRPRTGGEQPTNIAGPLCFSGDLLARRRPLPRARRGDLLLIRDVGAYTLAMWSRHCSRGLPATWGLQGDRARLLHRGERPEDVVRFWSL